MTNRERLARMSDEELARFLCKITSCAYCEAEDKCYMGHTGYVEWLKQDFVESMEVTEE